MTYTEAIERINRDHSLIFTAKDDEDTLMIWGDDDGFYVFLVQGLVDVGTPWRVFELDWKEGHWKEGM
ncbi:hypothetical protein [Exiguobacterium sp. s102]|uniref:hypothetical protein n=1 Tax=Exiguobacterium sp. s102 TaxID=2751212 RepID=UPI001BE5BBE8|nr:hypothetical protein [Exiguobacterium sp. s102]